MAVDEVFISKLEKETNLLRKLQEELGRAIKRADEKIDKLRHGASIDDVFPPKK